MDWLPAIRTTLPEIGTHRPRSPELALDDSGSTAPPYCRQAAGLVKTDAVDTFDKQIHHVCIRKRTLPTANWPAMRSAREIPIFYRVMLRWVDPALAAAGVLLAVADPARYLHTMTPRVAYRASLQVLLDQLAGTYAMLAFNGAVVLRVADDVRVWDALELGILMCDLLHVWATARALGLGVFLSPAAWRFEDWVNVLTLAGLALTRASFLLRLGFSPDAKTKRL
ncbi:hypothetical protein RB595_002622 [Gaeumannomyces hyphopodioides]